MRDIRTILNLVILNLIQIILTITIFLSLSFLSGCAPKQQKMCVLNPYWNQETLQQLGYGPEDCCRYRCVPQDDYNEWIECKSRCEDTQKMLDHTVVPKEPSET